MRWLEKIKPYAKLAAYVLTVIVSGVADYALPIPEQIIGWIQLAIVLLGGLAVYRVPNKGTGKSSAGAGDGTAGGR